MGSKVKQKQAVQKSDIKSSKNLETSGESKNSKAQKATKVAKNAKAPKTSKKSHKKRIIAIVLVVVLLLGAVGGLVTWVILNNREPEMSDWAEVYLTHIKTVCEQDRKNTKTSKQDDNSDDDESFWNNQDAKPAVSFYESENNSPTMVVNYTSIENNLSYNSVAVYSIQNEEIYLLNYENTNLYYVYDIDMNTYNFYLKHENEDEGEDTYVDIEDYFKDPEADESQYEKTCSTDEKADDYCGDVYVEESVELPSFEYSDEMTNKELAEAVAETSTEVVTEQEVKQESIEKMQQSAEKAKERVKKKEEAKEFFMVGDQKVRFGKYEYAEGGPNWTGKVFFELKPDYTMETLNYEWDASGTPTLKSKDSRKFEVRPIRHGDVASTCFGDNCPPYEDQFNGTLAIIVENPKGANYIAPLVTQPVSEKLWGKRNNPQIPTQYDLMPVYGQMAIYYRFLSK